MLWFPLFQNPFRHFVVLWIWRGVQGMVFLKLQIGDHPVDVEREIGIAATGIGVQADQTGKVAKIADVGMPRMRNLQPRLGFRQKLELQLRVNAGIIVRNVDPHHEFVMEKRMLLRRIPVKQCTQTKLEK